MHLSILSRTQVNYILPILGLPFSQIFEGNKNADSFTKRPVPLCLLKINLLNTTHALVYIIALPHIREINIEASL